MRRRWPFTLTGVLAIIAGCGGSFRATEDFSLTTPWENCSRLEVRTRNGGVEVHVGAGDEIRVSGTKGASGATLDEARRNAEQITIHAAPDSTQSGTFIVEARFPDTLQNRNAYASLRIVVPVACEANVVTANGRITAQGLTGKVMLETSNGPVDVKDIDGELRVTTSNGRIKASDVVGDCWLRTTNGRVYLEAVEGNADVDASNGSIEAHVTPPTQGFIKLRTSNGRIYLNLPQGMAADLRARTSNGRIHTELGDAALKHVETGRDRFRAEINGGGGEVVAETSNGSITIECH